MFDSQHRCPHCGWETTQPNAIAVAHRCPTKGNRLVDLVVVAANASPTLSDPNPDPDDGPFLTTYLADQED